MKTTRVILLPLAVAAGFAVGWRLAGRHRERHKAALFNANRIRRRAALGYLAGQESAETVRLLRDYIAWEPLPALRKRAQRVVRRMELHLT